MLPDDGGDAGAVLERVARTGIDGDALAGRLQREGAQAFAKSWQSLMQRIDETAASLAGAHQRNA